MTSTRPITSPCIKVCIVDDESSLCVGCLRTLEEIAAWPAMTEDARVKTIAELAGRRDRITVQKLAGQ